MTRKDVELVAWIIRRSWAASRTHAPSDAADAAHMAMVEEFAQMLSLKHPRFDAGRFRRACQP